MSRSTGPDGFAVPSARPAPFPRTARRAPRTAAVTGALASTVAVAPLAGAAPASASRIVYQCGTGVCSIDPNTADPPVALTGSGVVAGITEGAGGSTPTARGAVVASKRLRLRGGRIAVTVRCTAATTCTGTVRIAKGSTVLGDRSYRIAKGRRATLSVRPTSRGRRVLARSRKHAVTVRLKPRRGASVTTKLTLRR